MCSQLYIVTQPNIIIAVSVGERLKNHNIKMFYGQLKKLINK